MLAGMSALDVAEWAAYFELEPWGEDRADLRAGIVASAIANVHGVKSVPADFMPYRPKTERVISDDEIAASINRFMRRYH